MTGKQLSKSFALRAGIIVTKFLADLGVTGAKLNANVVDDVGLELVTSRLELKDNLIILEHQTAANVHAGGTTTGSWLTRPLNVEVRDPNAWCSLASNQFTLPAGTYIIKAWGTFFSNNNFTQQKIRNITDAADVALGLVNRNISDSGNSGFYVAGVVTIAAPKAFAIQYRCSTTVATFGLGYAMTWGVNVYLHVEITRLK